MQASYRNYSNTPVVILPIAATDKLVDPSGLRQPLEQ